jgi:hypothetical protein
VLTWLSLESTPKTEVRNSSHDARPVAAGEPFRPAGHGSPYRIEVQWPRRDAEPRRRRQGPGRWNPDDPAKAAFQARMKARQLQLSQGDKLCRTQT